MLQENQDKEQKGDQRQRSIIDYNNASGVIAVNLRNDMMTHMVMSKNNNPLKSLVCAFMQRDPETIKSVTVTNPIDYNISTGKEVILDVKVEIDDREIIDLEVQVYNDSKWEKRSLLYLARTYDRIGQSEDFDKLKPTRLLIITDKNLTPAEDSFFSDYQMLNTKTLKPYSSLWHISVLRLNKIEKATDEDKQCGLVMWAKVFSANTWEELKAIAEANPVIEEVLKTMLAANMDNQQREILEAHQRYVATLNGLQESKDIVEKKLEEANATILNKEKQILDKDKQILDKDKQILDKDKQIEELKRQLAEANRNNNT